MNDQDILDILKNPEKYLYVNASVINVCDSILIYYYCFNNIHCVIQSNIIYHDTLIQRGFFNEGIKIIYTFAEKTFTIDRAIEKLKR